MSYPNVKFGDICTTTQGVQISKSETFDEPYAGGYRYLYIADFVNDQKCSYVDDVYDSKKVTEHDLVMANTGSPGRVFKGKDGILSNNLFKISFDQKVIDRDYLFLVLASDVFQTVLGRQMKGGIQKHLGHQTISRQEIPLPTLPEQRRIAAILDQADALRTKRREALAQLDSLTQSIFVEMFGDPLTNSKNWDVQRLGDEAKVQGGFAFKSSDYVNSGVRLVKISNVHKDDLTWDELDYLPSDFLYEHDAFKLNAGDIVLALTRPIIQSLDSVKIAVVRSSDMPCLLNQRVARFVFRKTSRLNSEYLLGFCRSAAFFNSVKKFCSESLQPNISTSQIEGLSIPTPPLSLQNEYSQRICAVAKLFPVHRSSLTELDNLFNSLQHRAFRGEL